MVLNYGDHSAYASSMFGSRHYGHPASHHPYAQLNALAAASYGTHQPAVAGQYEFSQYPQSVVDHFPVHHHQHHSAMGSYLYDYRSTSSNPTGSVSVDLDAWSTLQGSSTSANTSLNSSHTSGSSSVTNSQLSPTYRTSPASNTSSVTDSYGHSQISPNPCAHNLYSNSSSLHQPSVFFGSSNIKSELNSFYMSSGTRVHSPPQPATETHTTIKGEASENISSQRHKFDWANKSAYSGQQTCTPVSGKTRTKDKYRVVYSDTQRGDLEDEFGKNKYISVKRKAELARELQLSERQVKIWFQNRRAKERKQTKKRPADAVPVTSNHMNVASKLGCTGAALHPAVMHSHPQMIQQHQLYPSDMERMERYYVDSRAHLKV